MLLKKSINTCITNEDIFLLQKFYVLKDLVKSLNTKMYENRF